MFPLRLHDKWWESTYRKLPADADLNVHYAALRDTFQSAQNFMVDNRIPTWRDERVANFIQAHTRPNVYEAYIKTRDELLKPVC